MDQASLKNLLQEALTSDTARVKEATAKLKTDYYKNPQSLGLLLQILTDDDSSAEIRQLAATQARALVPRHWNAVPDSHKDQVREHVLQATLGEERSLVRHNAARVVAAIAKVDAQDGQWAELPSQLLRCATSGVAREREVGTYLLFTVLDAMGEESAGQFATLFQLFSKTIHDSESAEVRINTMLALSKMALVIDPDDDEASLVAFQKLLPDMVGVLKQTIDAHDEERTLQSFEVFQTLLEADPRLLNKYFGDLVSFMGEAASAANLDKDARVAALNFLVSCVLYRKLKFQALRIGEQMVERLVHILFTSEDDSPADEEEFGLTLSVLSLLSLMSSQLPPSQAVVPTLKLFKQYASSSDPKQKRSVLTAFASCVEGAPEFLDTQVDDVKPLVLQLLGDSDIRVRAAAVSVTKELAEALPEAIGKDHEKFMAGVARNLNAAMSGLSGNDDSKLNQEVVVNCCAAMDNMAGGLEPDDLKPYLGELVPHISRLFSHPEHNVKAAAIGAVGSIAQAAKDGFLPFFEDTMAALQEYVQVKEGEEEMNLRSMTCDAMGDMATAVGPDAFKRYVQPLMQATEEGLHLDNPRLKETSYMFWGTMAGVYKEDFKPFLTGSVKSIFEALDQKEAEVDIELGGDEELVGQEVTIAGKKVKVVEAAGDDDDDDDDDEFDDMADDDSDEDWADIAGISAISQEKEVAIEALAEIFSNVGSDFMPYFEPTIQKVLPELNSAYEGLRRSAVSTLFRAYATIFKINDTEHEPGLPLKHTPSSELAQFGDVLMTATLALWAAEDDENVVMEVNTNLAETLKLTGPAIISGEGKVEQTVQTLVSILTKKHLCQQSLEDDEDDVDDLESSEDEMVLISSAMDTVAGLASALGGQFAELWKIFEKTILGFASASESGYRSAAVGSIAEVVRGMGSGSSPYTASLLKVILHRLADEDPQVKSNAAFAAGVLVEHSDRTDELTKAYPQILQRLEPMLQAPESRQLDNAAGCVSRMILMHPGSLPLKEILPVLVGVLPLKEDYEENIPVYQMLYKMFDSEQGRGLIDELGLRAKLKPVFAAALGEPEDQLTDTTRDMVKKMAGAL